MKFRTEVNTVPKPDFISYKSDMLAIGSCFADEIGMRLQALKFPIDVNPFGVIFNPVSLAELLTNALESRFDETLFVSRDGHWFHHGYHSKVNAPTMEALSQKITGLNANVHKSLNETNVLLLTFGSAWVYKHNPTNSIVSNCHKVSQDQFSKKLLDFEVLKGVYFHLFETLFKHNPKLNILLTISPVRHIKDGVYENNVSKSVLHLLTHFLVSHFKQVHYFPSYELIVDDLRDYRFYKEDLIHPTNQAVEYVFEKFSATYFSDKTKEAVRLQQAILKLKAHKPLGLIDSNEEKIRVLENQFELLKQN